ncbi:MAG: hypothetical protein ACR2NG_04645 [Acidimicrobiia bacterium]
MRRAILMVCGVLLIVTSCGGESTDDGGDQPTTTQPATDDGTSATTPDSQAPTTTQSDASESPAGEGPSTASVTIGDMTFNATSEGVPVAQCLSDLFGTMVVNLPLAGGEDGSIQIVALHEGTNPAEVEVDNRVHVSIGDFDWWADPLEINLGPDEAAMSRVELVEVDGSTLTGTATFTGRDLTTREWVTMPGTFEATCGEERTS